MKSNQLSRTAAYVAIKFYGLTLENPYHKLFDNETLSFYDRLVSEFPAPLDKYHRLLQNKWIRSATKFIDELLLPGDLMHILMRKYYISKMVEQLVKKEYKQMIILGAGFDHLGKVYSNKGVTCVELDVPLMAQIKQQFLDKNNFTNKNLTVFPANFSRASLSDFMREIPQVDPDLKTIAVAEGFFDYLTHREFSNTLKDLSGFFRNKLSLISTVFSINELSTFHAFVFRNAVKAVGEKIKLHLSIEDFTQILSTNSLCLEKRLSAKDMMNHINTPEVHEKPILPGFYILQASNT